MAKSTKPQLEPRKSPVQARSAASVEAIREATIQVLLAVGKEHLTTTKVAHRAGVSVGTLYQYFPNKSSLLQAVLKAHLDFVYGTTISACDKIRGLPLVEMTDRLVTAFLEAKMQCAETSRALYFVSDDLGAMQVVREYGERGIRSIAAMLATAPEPLRVDAQIIASTLIGAMAGVSRRMIESGRVSPRTMQAMRHELVVMVRAYAQACTG
ncbi:TetR/AcrR family transcriptional regulator [Edaphobacter flagellatus]|uniref:TetR/AcrR family transcriptional regulator n=1 Tax=Edaphobacter flagellatus TaxID=1933044 RepID=UPI0021B2297F|nr:TetR/AcrR family transcriptional regulator [Edaphobacter flagellatus]